jgi:hypothetical protein
MHYDMIHLALRRIDVIILVELPKYRLEITEYGRLTARADQICQIQVLYVESYKSAVDITYYLRLLDTSMSYIFLYLILHHQLFPVSPPPWVTKRLS